MWDQGLFLFLNFDGGRLLDTIMLTISGIAVWIPLYLLILYLVWRRSGWQATVLLLITIVLAVGLSDLIAGIFKKVGILKGLLPNFPARLRPMHTPEFEGLIHVVKAGGLYGTISAHAATALSIGIIASRAIAKRWFSIVMFTQVGLVCYSRIYLSYHFPQDILLGCAVGGFAGCVGWLIYKKIAYKYGL